MVLAARGARNLDGGVEPVEEAEIAEALRRRGRNVTIATVAVTVAIVFAASLLVL